MSDRVLRKWEEVVSLRDRQVYAAAGYHRRGGLGTRPALLVIDTTYAFVGDRPEPILESVKRFTNSCGEVGWQAVSAIHQLLNHARPKRIPIIYTAGIEAKTESESGRWASKHGRVIEESNVTTSGTKSIVKEIAPRSNDYVLSKSKPSAFFGTPLLSYLIQNEVNTLLVSGCTTSGCVRASVLDAFSYNYRIGVIEETVFDRGEVSHLVNLWDMNAKYADVITLSEACDYLNKLQPLTTKPVTLANS